MKELYTAFIAAQREIKTALKDSKNPHYKATYANWESVWDACCDALHKHNLGIMQLTDLDPSGVPVLVTRIVHQSGQHVEGRYPLVCKDLTDAQKLGSSMSYAKRYALSAMLGVIQSDNDGNGASAQSAKQGPASLFAAHGLC